MLIESFEGGPVDTIGYLIADRQGGTAAVIDSPQDTAAAIVEQARRWDTKIAYLLTTHPHWDHILDNDELLRRSSAKWGLHRDGVPLLAMSQTRMFGFDVDMPTGKPDFFLEEGKPVEVGDLEFEILDCPGHCHGSVALFEPTEKLVFTGDVLFAGSIGRADLPGGNMATLLRSIREKLLPLGDEVRVLAGHGPETTIGEERRGNPFLTGQERF
jgi:glyoxylase-like metal-dependent hydrolase (beta-lactamase superfamily II)